MLTSHATEQYRYIQNSRQALFYYCRTIRPDDFVNANTTFGGNHSMRNLLVHIANTYELWVAQTALKKQLTFSEYTAHPNIAAIEILFTKVDRFMHEFIATLDTSNEPITFTIGDTPSTATPLKLFTHVITHEYHHKGQVLSLSRNLGYTPVDTDVVR